MLRGFSDDESENMMVALRRYVTILSAVLFIGCGGVLAPVRAQVPGDPVAQQKAYDAILVNPDAGKRAEALELFIAFYPNNPLMVSAHEQLMASWQAAGELAKADAAANKLLQIDPGNVRALANRVYVGRARLAAGDTAGLAALVAMAERGLAALPKWQKPDGLAAQEFTRLKLQATAIFDSVLGFSAQQAKDLVKARRYYVDAVTIDPNNLQDSYQLSVVLLDNKPLDPLGFWYAARAIALARAAKNDGAAAGIDNYARPRYRGYHGSEEGWDALITRVADGQRLPPDNFGDSISRALTTAEAAVQAVATHDPSTLSFADWEFILAQRDASAANKEAADKVWKAIVDKQRGGEARLKIVVKVVSAATDRLKAAITEENQQSGTADLDIALSRPLAPLPSPGVKIAVIGVLGDYQPKPFLFRMTHAELADESLPVAGGACASPRPQMCTQDFRPACGLRRDGTRKTYGNACSACADTDVESQAAGACP
jgi:tetratricopeptide (TPR) repeat protein